MTIERITAEPDLIRTALQQKYLDEAGVPVIRVDPDGVADLFVHEEAFEAPDAVDQPDEGVDLQPERFVGDDLALPDPAADRSSEELEALTEELATEVEAALVSEVDLNADRDGDPELVPVEYETDNV